MNKFGIIGIVMLMLLSFNVMATDFQPLSPSISGGNWVIRANMRFSNGNSPSYGASTPTSNRDRFRIRTSVIRDSSDNTIQSYAFPAYSTVSMNFLTNYRSFNIVTNTNVCDNPFSYVRISSLETQYYFIFLATEEWRSESPAGILNVNANSGLSSVPVCWDYPTASITIDEIGLDFVKFNISYDEEDWDFRNFKLLIDGQEFDVTGTGTQEVTINGLEPDTLYNFDLDINANGHTISGYNKEYNADTLSFTTLKLNGSVNATGIDSNYPNPVIIEYNTTNTNVSILSNETEIYNGFATGSLEYFDDVGVYNITIIALEDDTYYSANTSFLVEVLQEVGGFDLKVNRERDNITLVYGEPLLIEYSGESVLGYIDGLPISSGYKEILNAGTYEVFAEVNSSNYFYENATYIVEVVKAQGHSRIVVDRNNIVYPNNVSYSIYSRTNQSMEVYINDSLLLDNLLPFGTHEIKVVALENDNYLEHNHSVWVTMSRGKSIGTITGRNKYYTNDTNVSIVGTLIQGDGDIYLTRNGIEVSNPDTSLLPFGNYYYELVVENSTNYINGVLASQSVSIAPRFLINEIEFNLENVILLIFLTFIMLLGWLYSKHFIIPFYFLILSVLIFMTPDFHNLYGIICLIVFGFTFLTSNFE